MTTASLATVDRVSITTVVDNSIDNLRVDEKVARRFTQARARKMPTLRAELGLDPARVDALALSHGHQDHFGGLARFLGAYRRRMRPGLPFYGGVDHFL